MNYYWVSFAKKLFIQQFIISLMYMILFFEKNLYIPGVLGTCLRSKAINQAIFLQLVCLQ